MLPLHVTPAGFNAHTAPPDGLIIAEARLNRAMRRAAPRVDGGPVLLRVDAATQQPYVDDSTPAERRAKFWAEVQCEVIRDVGSAVARARDEDLRGDALNTAGGLLGREMLVQLMPVIEEPLPVFEFAEVAEVDSTLPLGAESYRLEYQRLTGEAGVMRSGQTAPIVDASRDRVDRPHHVLWSRSVTTFLDDAQGRFAGLNVSEIKQSANEPAHLSVVDSLFWKGDNDLGHWGVYNYPAIPEYSTGLSLAALTFDTLRTAILQSVARVRQASQRRFTPTVIRMSVIIYGYAEALTNSHGISVLQSLREGGYTVEQCVHLDSWNGVAGSYAIMCDGAQAGARMRCFFRPPILVPGNVNQVSAEMYAISGYGGAFMPHPVGCEVTLFTA